MSSPNNECCHRRDAVSTRVKKCEVRTRIRKELGTNLFEPQSLVNKTLKGIDYWTILCEGRQ